MLDFIKSKISKIVDVNAKHRDMKKKKNAITHEIEDLKRLGFLSLDEASELQNKIAG